MKAHASHRYHLPQYGWFVTSPKKPGATSVIRFSGGKLKDAANWNGSACERIVSAIA